MRTVTLGNTSVEISEFIFGAGAIGGIGGSPATLGRGIIREQGLDRLDEARDLGITVVDTADVYGGGESERTVGAWYQARKPQNVLLQTKVGSVEGAGPGQQQTDLSRPHIERQLARSIDRLGRVDLYLSHGPDTGTPLAGGVLSDRYLESAVPEPGSRIAVAGPLYYPGMYTAENLVKVSALRDFARDREMSVAGMALSWLRAHPLVTAPIVSPSRPEQWNAVREALHRDLSEADYRQIGAIFAP